MINKGQRKKFKTLITTMVAISTVFSVMGAIANDIPTSAMVDPFADAPFLLLDEEFFILSQNDYDKNDIVSDVFLPNIVPNADGTRNEWSNLHDRRKTWSTRPPLRDGKIGDQTVMLRDSENRPFLAQIWEKDWLHLCATPLDKDQGYGSPSMEHTVSTRTFSGGKISTATGDLNGDRAKELVIGYRWSASRNEPSFAVFSLANWSQPLFFDGSTMPPVHEKSGVKLATGDINGDGKSEIGALYLSKDGNYVLAILSLNEEGNQIGLMGTHTLDVKLGVDTYLSTDSFDLAFADWDGNGKFMVFCAMRNYPLSIEVRLIQVSLDRDRVDNFKTVISTPIYRESSFLPDTVVAQAADINGDGRDELLFTNRGNLRPKEVDLSALYRKADGFGQSRLSLSGSDVLPPIGLRTGNFTGSFHPSSRSKNRSQAILTLDNTVYLISMERDQLTERSRAWMEGYGSRTRRIMVGDLDGDSMLLGTPTHITLENHVTPILFMSEPPKHLDFDPDSPEKEVENHTRDDELFVRYAQSTVESQQTTNTLEVEGNMGGSLGLEVSAGLNLGVAEISTTVKTTMTASTKEKYSTQYGHKADKSEGLERATNRDDCVLFRTTNVHVWRYPILGWTTKLKGSPDKTVPAYYQVTIPEKETRLKFLDGMAVDWYHPVHMNGNVLSYPSSTSQIEDFDGSLRLTRDVTLPVGGGNPSTQTVSWSDEETKESLKSVTLSMGLDLEVQNSASGVAEIFTGGVKTSATFHMDEQTTNTDIARTSVQKNDAFLFNSPKLTSRFRYDVSPLMYRTSKGVLKATQVVDRSIVDKENWRRRYDKPDPALNLPRTWQYDQKSGKWIWVGGESDRTRYPEARRIRGIFFEDVAGVDLGKYLPIGKRTTIKVRVHNFSLEDCPPVKVLFEIAPKPYNEDSFRELGTAQSRGISRWGEDRPNWEMVTFSWDTSGMEAGNYRVRVTVNPNGSVGELSEKGYGGHYDNNHGWYDVFLGTGARSSGPKGDEGTNLNLVARIELTNSPEDGQAFKPGETAILRAEVKNEGNMPVGNLSLFIYDGNPDLGGTSFANLIISGVNPGEEHSRTVSYTVEGSGHKRIFMRLIPKVGDPPEDNTASISLPIHGGSSVGCLIGHGGSLAMLTIAIPLALFGKRYRR